MIISYEKITLLDENGKNNFWAEVNWKPDDSKTNECKVLKITFPDGKEAFVKRDYFQSFLFAISKPEEQRDMIPQVITKVHSKETLFGIKATRDIAKGEMINFSAKVDFECPYYKQEVLTRGRGKGQVVVNK